MKALSVQQPWASLIIHGPKDVENRTWRTQYRGLVAIHASLKHDPDGDAYVRYHRVELPPLEYGHVIGTVTLVDCVRNHGSAWADASQWNWVLTNRVPLPCASPAKGALGLWEWTP